MSHRAVSKTGCVLAGLLFLSCGWAEDAGKEALKDRLYREVNSLRVVNCHEHQHRAPEFANAPHNFYSLLARSYLRADLVSAGAPRMDVDLINRGDLNLLWETYGPFLEFSRNTTYYSHFLRGFQVLYDFREESFDEASIAELSERIQANYADLDAWYDEAFRRAGFEVMFVDQYWNHFNTELDRRYFALVLNINSLVGSVSDRTRLLARESPVNNPFQLAAREGFEIRNLEDYLAFASRILDRFVQSGVVCLKNSMAYSRSLDYDEVPFEEADRLFRLESHTLTDPEKKALQDHVFHWIIGEAIRHDLPIQIHTGYLAGNGNILENSRATLLTNLFLRYPEARFVLLHGAYPWTGESGALAKMFPNVFLDLVWLPQLSREAAILSFDEMLDLVPYGKFFWGGDCHVIEESVGSLEFAKDVVVEVLARRVARGLMTEALALEVARAIFRENALRFFDRLSLSH